MKTKNSALARVCVLDGRGSITHSSSENDTKKKNHH